MLRRWLCFSCSVSLVLCFTRLFRVLFGMSWCCSILFPVYVSTFALIFSFVIVLSINIRGLLFIINVLCFLYNFKGFSLLCNNFSILYSHFFLFIYQFWITTGSSCYLTNSQNFNPQVQVSSISLMFLI